MISEKPVLSVFSIENFPNTSKGLDLDIDVRRLSSVIIRILLNVISVIFLVRILSFLGLTALRKRPTFLTSIFWCRSRQFKGINHKKTITSKNAPTRNDYRHKKTIVLDRNTITPHKKTIILQQNGSDTEI